MKLSIYQLQALDYLQKRVTATSSSALHGKKLQLVIEYNNNLWYGDFLNMNGNTVIQNALDADGDVFPHSYNLNSPGFLEEIIDAFKKADNHYHYFRNVSDLLLFFENLVKSIKEMDIKEDSSPFYSYLFNAKSLDGKYQLPFINFANKEIELVSIIDVTNSLVPDSNEQ